MAQEAKTTTLVAVFEDYTAAQQAARELGTHGIQQNAIQLESNLRTGAAGHGGSSDYQEGDRENNQGGFTGWIQRLFGSDDSDSEAGHYSEAYRRGNAILSVTVPDTQTDSVSDILNRQGAIDIDERAQAWRQTGYTGHNPAAPPYTHEESARERDRYANPQAGAKSQSVPVIEEELQVGKRAVRRGGVRVYSRVVSQPVEEKVNLREEHVRVERRAVNRPVSDADISQLRDQTIEVTEMAEEPVISKRARIKEEVVVGKEATERTETVRGNVRHTEVRVDQMAGGETVGRGAAGQTGSDLAYDYGYRAAGDASYRGRSWNDAENDLRTGYMKQNPNGKWEEAKDSIRRGWDKVTGRL